MFDCLPRVQSAVNFNKRAPSKEDIPLPRAFYSFAHRNGFPKGHKKSYSL